MGQGDKYEKLNTEYEKLKQMNQHQVAECSAFKNECNSLKQKVSDLENQVANVQNENCNMKSDLKEKNSVKESEFKNVTAQLKVEKENFKILEKKSSDEIKNLRNLLETKEKEIDRIVMDSKGKEEKFTATLKAITMEVQNLKDSNIRKTNQDSQAKAKLEQEMGELKGNLGCKEQELLKLNKDLKFLRDSLTNAQTNAESLKADIKNKEIGLSKQKELTDNLQKDLDRQVKDLSESNEKHEQRIKSILKELENVKDQNKNLLSRFEKAERENETLRSESKSVKEENESLGKKILGLEKTKDCLTTQIGQIKIETEKLIQMNGSFKQETDELKNMLTGKEREAEHLKVELSHTVEKLQDSDMKRDTIHSECQKYEELAHTLQNELSSEKLKFEDECKSLKSVISVNEQNLKHLQGDYDKLKIEIEDMKACNENLITKGKEHEHNYERAVIDNAELEKTLENKIKEIETLHMKLNKLAEEMKDTVIEKSATEKEIEELKFNQESLQDRLNSVENHLETANKQLLETTENINALKAENQILFSENRQCNEQLEIVKTELDGKNNQHIKDQEVIACVQQDLSLLRDKCGVMKAEETDRTNQFLQEIESLRSELEGKTHIIDSLETQIQNKTSECERIQKLFDTITIENTDMTMRTNSLQGKIEELVSSQDDLMNLKEKYELEISNMKTEIIKHKDELQTAQNLEKEFSIEMNRKLEELNNIAAGKETEIESCKIEISHSYEKIDSLNKLVLEANNAVEEKDLIIQKQSSEINELKTNVSETSEALQKYAHDYDGCIRQITAFKDMESENKAKFNEFKIQADNEIETLKLLIEKKESDLKAVQQEISKKCLELQETTNKLEHTLAAKCEAESNIQQLLTETEAQKSMIFSLQEEKDRLVAETESLLCDLKLSKDMSHEKELDTTAVITQLNENLRELQIILEDRDKEIEGLRKSVSDKTETFDLKLSELLLKEKENKECLTQITLLERCNEELQHQIRNEREFREVTDSHNKELKVEVDTLKDRVGNLSIESSDQLSKLSRELSETQIVVEEKVVEIEKMKSELCQKTDELIEKEAEFEKVCILKSDMEIMVKTLEKENETLHFSMSDMKDGKHQAEAELDKLKTEIKQLQDDLSDQAMEESVNTAKLNQEIKELHSCVESKDSELNELREKFCCKSEVLQAKKTEIENVLAANLELENKIFGLNTTIDETKHLLSEALKREENLLEMTSSLKNEAKEMQDKINSQQLEESVKLANLNQELADAQNNSALKEQELSSLKDSAEAREMEMQTLRNEIAKVLSDKALVESVQASQEKELDELKFRFSDTNSKLENMILSISEKEKEVVSLKDDLSDEAMEHSVIMAKLNQKLKELESEVESKEMQIKKVKEENNQISDLYQKEHTVKVSLEEETSSKELELLTAKEKVKELTFEIEEVKKATMSNLDHIAALNGSIVSLKDELQLKDQELSGKIAEVQKTSSELSSALYVKEQELETSKTEICHMNGRISEMETLLETSRKVTQESENLNAKYLKENEELNVTIAGKNDEIQTIKIALERAVDEKEKLQTTSDENRIVIDDYKVTSKTLSNEIETLKQSLENRTNLESKHLETINELERDIRGLKDQLNEKTIEMSGQKELFKQEISEQTHQRENLEVKVSDLNNELSCNFEILKEKESNIERLEKEKESLGADLCQQQKTSEELQLEVSELKKNEIENRIAMEKMKADLGIAQDTLNTQTIERAASVADLEGKLEERTSLCAERENKIQLLTEELSKKCKEVTDKYSVCHNMEEKIKELENIIISHKSEIEGLEFEVSERKTNEEHQRNEIQKLLDVNTKYKNDLNEKANETRYSESVLSNHIQDLEVQSLQKDQTVLQLTEELSHYKADLESIADSKDKLLSQLEDTNFKLSQEISDVEASNGNMTLKIEGLQKELSKANNQVIETSSQLENAVKEKVQIEEICQKRSCQLQVSQSDCEELQEQMQSLEKKLAHLEKEKEIFEHREETFTERLTSLDMEKISMMRVLEEKQNVIDGQLTRIKDLEIDIDHKEAKLNSLVEKLRTAEIVKLDAEQNSEKLAGDLNEQKFCHDEKIKELENRLLMLNQDNQKASADKLELDKTNRELCILVERMEEKEKVLENELHEKQVECSSLDMKVNNLKKDCQDLEKKVLEFTKILSDSETERLKVGQSLSETEFKLEKVNEELSVSQTKNSELREEFNVSVLKTESLTNELCNLKLKLSETLESYGETQQSLKEKKDKIAELEDRVEKSVCELTEIKDKCSEDSLNMKNRTVEYENLLSELHNTVESKNIEINKYHELQSHLEHKMIKLEEKCNKAECTLSETLTTLQQKETLIEELKLNASETQSVLKDFEENVNRKQSEIQELKDRINVDSTHSTELSCAMQNEVKDLKGLLLSKSDEIGVLEKEIISKTDKLMHSQSKIEELDDIIKSNESLITKLSQDKDDLELNLIDKINTKESLIQSLEEKLIVHEKELEITLKEKKVIEQQLEALQTSYREKEIDLKTAALEKSDNKEMLLKLEEEKQNLVETIEKLHLDISAMRAENGNYKQKVGEAEHELLATQAFSQNLQGQLDERDHSYKSLQDKVSRLTTQNNELEAALQQSDIELQRTRLELEDKTTEQDDLFEKQNNESQELRDKISTLNNVIQNYERDIMSLENDKVNLIKDNQVLIKEKETVSIKLDSMENTNNDLAQSLEERQKRICSLEEGLETIRNDNDMFEIQIRKMKDEAVETNDHLSQLKILVTENEEENVKLRSKSMQDSSDMQIQQAKLRELELECQGKTSIIQELEDSVSSLREKHAAIDELNRNKIKDLTDSVSSLTNELQSKVQESSQRFAEVDSLAADLLESQAVNARSELEISELKEKFSSATHEIYIKEKMVESLETEVENLKLTASEVQDELIEKEKMHKESETQLCQLQTEFGQLQEQLRSVAAEKEELESMVEFSAMENSEKDEKLSCLQQEMSDHLERHKSFQTMQKEFDDVSKELILVKQRTSEMEDLLNAVQIEKDSVCAESKEKDLELRGLKEKLVSIKAKEKEQESTIENLKDMMESLEFENNSLETEKAALENELKELTLKEKCCEQENNKLKEQICILGQEMDSLHSAIEQYKSKEQSYKDRSDAMNSELLEMKEKYKAVSSVETKLRGEVQELHAKIESMEVCFSSFDSQKSELLEARGELQTLSTEKISLQQKIATQEREKNDLLSQFLALEDQKSSADKDNSALQAQVIYTKRSITSQEHHLKKLINS